MDNTAMYINIFKSLWQVFIILLPFIIIGVIIMLARAKMKNKKKSENKPNKPRQANNSPRERIDYENSDYYKETKASYEEMITDKGRTGEYAAYRNICSIAGYKRFLFDVYVESKENKNRTEIDIVLIHEKGIYVIECKNYRGWIYGDEASEKWCQGFKNGKKFFFYNPIKQNYRHIQYLREIIGKDKDITSIIVFGDGATLKKIVNTNQQIKIINNRELKAELEKEILNKEAEMQPEQIDEIYNKLKSKQW